VKHRLPDFAYANLESPDVRAFATEDPHALLAECGEPVILDEIQRVPALLSYLQARVVEEPGNGRFVITGSHQLELRAAVAQSLAGRTNTGPWKPELYFFRDHNGLKIDPLQRRGRDLIGIEIRSASTLHAKMRDGLVRFDANVTPLAQKLLVYNGSADGRGGRRWSNGVQAIDFRRFAETLANMAPA